MSTMLLVPLEDIVVFPNMNVTLTVDVGDEERVLLVPKHDDGYAKVGTVAEVTDRIGLPGGGLAVALNGLHRAIAGAAATDTQGRLFIDVEERPDEEPKGSGIRELEREYRAVVEEILELRGDDGRIAAFVRSITGPGALYLTAAIDQPDTGWIVNLKDEAPDGSAVPRGEVWAILLLALEADPRWVADHAGETLCI